MSTQKILLALQHWRGDAEAASGLMRLLADVAPGGRYLEADLLVSVRWDTEFDMAAIKYAARAFDAVHTYRGRGHADGWPRSPNGLAYETYRWLLYQTRVRQWNYSGVWLIEPDSVPLSRDWLKQIAIEWKIALAARKHVLGFFVAYDDGRGVDHVNGNCLISPEFIHVCPGFAGVVTDLAWDMVHRTAMKAHGMPSKLIFSDYASGSMDAERLFQPFPVAQAHPLYPQAPLSPVWLHGWKNWQFAQDAVRNRLLGVPAS